MGFFLPFTLWLMLRVLLLRGLTPILPLVPVALGRLLLPLQRRPLLLPPRMILSPIQASTTFFTTQRASTNRPRSPTPSLIHPSFSAGPCTDRPRPRSPISSPPPTVPSTNRPRSPTSPTPPDSPRSPTAPTLPSTNRQTVVLTHARHLPLPPQTVLAPTSRTLPSTDRPRERPAKGFYLHRRPTSPTQPSASPPHPAHPPYPRSRPQTVLAPNRPLSCTMHRLTVLAPPSHAPRPSWLTSRTCRPQTVLHPPCRPQTVLAHTVHRPSWLPRLPSADTHPTPLRARRAVPVHEAILAPHPPWTT